MRLICTALRSHDPADNVVLAETASRFVDQGLTGWDLAGPEAAFPDPLDHARAFEAARAGGLRITLHAGEWGGAAQVRRALAVDPERIAHGPLAIDDPGLCRELADRGITLDLCPTSNVQAGIVESVAAHPLAALHRLGVPVTLSTDDTTVSDITLSEEYVRAVEQNGLTLPELWAIDRHALDVAFADADDARAAPRRVRCVGCGRSGAWLRRARSEVRVPGPVRTSASPVHPGGVDLGQTGQVGALQRHDRLLAGHLGAAEPAERDVPVDERELAEVLIAGRSAADVRTVDDEGHGSVAQRGRAAGRRPCRR